MTASTRRHQRHQPASTTSLGRPEGKRASPGSVTAVVVSYNVRPLLLACVAALERLRALGELRSVVVVDNDSDDGSAGAVRRVHPRVTVLDAPNRGYGAGANRGISASDSDYVLVLNADTVVPPGTVGRLAAYLDEHPRVAVVGPRIRYPDGSVQSTRRRFPTRLTPLFESTIVQEWWPANPWARAYSVAERPDDTVQSVDWLVGACLLVRRAAIDRVGGFDESFVMYSEEVEWCWRFRRHGWEVVYIPDVEIVHYEGASTRQDLPRRQLQFDAARVALMRRLYGDRWGTLTALVVRANYAAHLTREALKWLLGHRRSLRRARMALYARALVSGPASHQHERR